MISPVRKTSRGAEHARVSRGPALRSDERLHERKGVASDEGNLGFPRRTRRGFTLVELLIVLAIIGILAAISLTTISDARAKARDARRRGDLASLRLGLFLYADSSNGLYPASLAVTPATHDRSIDGVGIWSADPSANPLVPESLSARIVDPVNTASFTYLYDTDANDTAYVLCAREEAFSAGGQYLVQFSNGQYSAEPNCPSLN